MVASYPPPRRRRRRFPVACVTVIGMFAALCCAGALGVAYLVTAEEPDAPVTEDFVPQVDDAQAFEQTINQARQQAVASDHFDVSFTEQQLSSWMALEGRDYAARNGYTFPFDEIQVGLEDGRFHFYSLFTTAGLNLPLEITVRPYVDTLGHLALAVEGAQLGGLPVPSFILDGLLAQVERLLTEPIEAMRSDYAIDPASLTADGGVFTMSGSLR